MLKVAGYVPGLIYLRQLLDHGKSASESSMGCYKPRMFN
jgi:hypothetical protein